MGIQIQVKEKGGRGVLRPRSTDYPATTTEANSMADLTQGGEAAWNGYVEPQIKCLTLMLLELSMLV